MASPFSNSLSKNFRLSHSCVRIHNSHIGRTGKNIWAKGYSSLMWQLSFGSVSDHFCSWHLKMSYWKHAVSSPELSLLSWPDSCRHWLGSGCSQNSAPATDLKECSFPVLAGGQSPLGVVTSIQRFEELLFSLSIKNWRLLPMSKAAVFWAWAAHGPFPGSYHFWL